MLDTLIQYTLYAFLALAIVAGVSGVYFATLARKGFKTSLHLPMGVLTLIFSVGPFVGLLGTVWHIIEALSGIGSGNLNVAAIAQPIGEALYATMWGLAGAVVAFMFSNIIMMMLPEDAPSENAPAGSK